ncbi:MAG: molybdenum cofactor synthesis domain-containing protein [Candidatus Latescibacterota bacterium]
MTCEAIRVLSVNISDKKGTVKHPIERAVLDDKGIVGDAHAGTAHRLVSLLAHESVTRFEKEIGRKVAFGEFAENITTQGLEMDRVRLLDRFRMGGIELEVTQIGKKCHGDNCAIFREVGRCVMPKEGIFCRVIHGGELKAGDGVEFLPRQLNIKIITLSDRASRKEYEDRSGPRVRDLADDYLRQKKWRPSFAALIIPDDAEILAGELHRARDNQCDIVFTTGGTGIGPRDITPDVVMNECDKLIPGIMEHIRMTYGAGNPHALASRSVAGVMGNTLVFALPGSVKAVEEYMREILKTIEHLILMLHGLDVHKP